MCFRQCGRGTARIEHHVNSITGKAEDGRPMTERVHSAPRQTLEWNAADRRARETRVLRHHTVWWICVLAVLAIGVFQVYDVVRRHDIVMQTTERDFTSLVRVLAEQTARAVQAVDVVVRDTAADAGAI